MSKTWYPVINYEKCTECGACFAKCKHGVFKMEVSRPVVIHVEGCDHGCHGCGNLCPNGAIEYVGDNTGWVPPNDKRDNKEAACCGSEDNKEEGQCTGSGCCS